MHNLFEMGDITNKHSPCEVSKIHMFDVIPDLSALISFVYYIATFCGSLQMMIQVGDGGLCKALSIEHSLWIDARVCMG